MLEPHLIAGTSLFKLFLFFTLAQTPSLDMRACPVDVVNLLLLDVHKTYMASSLLDQAQAEIYDTSIRVCEGGREKRVVQRSACGCKILNMRVTLPVPGATSRCLYKNLLAPNCLSANQPNRPFTYHSMLGEATVMSEAPVFRTPGPSTSLNKNFAVL